MEAEASYSLIPGYQLVHVDTSNEVPPVAYVELAVATPGIIQPVRETR